MDGLLERLVNAIESLNANICRLDEATRALVTAQTTGRRPRTLTADLSQTAADMSRVFAELYEEDPDGEVSRAEILAHFKDCENDEILALIDKYDLTNCRSKGYRAFIDYARSRARRERMINGAPVLVGICMQTTTYVDKLPSDPYTKFC